jgi:hypothetical protein
MDDFSWHKVESAEPSGDFLVGKPEPAVFVIAA